MGTKKHKYPRAKKWTEGIDPQNLFSSMQPSGFGDSMFICRGEIMSDPFDHTFTYTNNPRHAQGLVDVDVLLILRSVESRGVAGGQAQQAGGALLLALRLCTCGVVCTCAQLCNCLYLLDAS